MKITRSLKLNHQLQRFCTSISGAGSTFSLLKSYTLLTIPERQQLCQKLAQDLLNPLFFNYLNGLDGGIHLAMAIKTDLRKLTKQFNSVSDVPNLLIFNERIKDWLAVAFCADSLELRRISFDTSCGTVLEKVARGEAVHRVRSLSELKRRLENGRRCYALFHTKLQLDPLVFIHIALADDVVPSLRSLHSATGESNPKCAIFYSVNSPIPALGGLDLATRLIKSASKRLRKDFPSITTFSTLSPIPGLIKWLKYCTKDTISLLKVLKAMPSEHKVAIKMLSKKEDEVAAFSSLVQLISDPIPLWTRDEPLSTSLKKPLMWLGCYYIAVEKQRGDSGYPLDDVARFHLRNGAVFYRLNWMGNESSDGLASSAGLMVNYLYASDDLSLLETALLGEVDLSMRGLPARAATFASTGSILVGEEVREILGGVLSL